MVTKYRSIDWEFDWVTFGVDMTAAMDTRGLTSQVVALKVGMTPSAVRRFMNGSSPEFHPLIGTFLALVNMLDLDPRHYWTVG